MEPILQCPKVGDDGHQPLLGPPNHERTHDASILKMDQSGVLSCFRRYRFLFICQLLGFVLILMAFAMRRRYSAWVETIMMITTITTVVVPLVQLFWERFPANLDEKTKVTLWWIFSMVMMIVMICNFLKIDSKIISIIIFFTSGVLLGAAMKCLGGAAATPLGFQKQSTNSPLPSHKTSGNEDDSTYKSYLRVGI